MSRRSRPGHRGFKAPVKLTDAAVRMLLGQAPRFLEGEEPNRVAHVAVSKYRVPLALATCHQDR
jgi:hypothetical protein